MRVHAQLFEVWVAYAPVHTNHECRHVQLATHVRPLRKAPYYTGRQACHLGKQEPSLQDSTLRFACIGAIRWVCEWEHTVTQSAEPKGLIGTCLRQWLPLLPLRQVEHIWQEAMLMLGSSHAREGSKSTHRGVPPFTMQNGGLRGQSHVQEDSVLDTTKTTQSCGWAFYGTPSNFAIESQSERIQCKRLSQRPRSR